MTATAAEYVTPQERRRRRAAGRREFTGGWDRTEVGAVVAPCFTNEKEKDR